MWTDRRYGERIYKTKTIHKNGDLNSIITQIKPNMKKWRLLYAIYKKRN
jgi:hypothetical protein